MQNINPGIPKNENQHQKSIFSCNVYRTDNHHRSTPFQFKSLSTTWNDSEVLYVNENAVTQKSGYKEVVKECSTQTSKTILELAKIETGCMSPDSLGASPRDLNYSIENCPYTESITNRLSDYTLDGSCQEQGCIFNNSKEKNCRSNSPSLNPTMYLDKPLTQTFLERNHSKFAKKPEIITCYKRENSLRSRSFIDHYHHPNYIQEPLEAKIERLQINPVKAQRISRKSSKSLDLPDNSFIRRNFSSGSYVQNTFMCPTTASQIKSKMAEIQSVNHLIPPVRRGRSTSPKPNGDQRRFESSKKIPYIDQSKSDVSSSTTIINTARNRGQKLKGKDVLVEELVLKTDDLTVNVKSSEDCLSENTNVEINMSIDTTICTAVNKFREPDWRLALRGLAEIVELCRIVDVDLIYDYMTSINQRLIELLKSPRSHVCRTACQAAGHLFEYVKDTRRPEFDDIVDLLLHKTADANKFIRQDANLALDCMVTHIPTLSAVRALCSKGPLHKNHLVRCATVRLLVCITVIAGADFILNPNSNEYTRKRIILNLVKFLEDKNLETRKLAERLYKILHREPRFDVYLKKYLEKEQIAKIKKTLKLIHKK